MHGFYVPDGAGFGANDHTVGGHTHFAVEMDAFQHRSVGDAGSGEKRIFGGDEVTFGANSIPFRAECRLHPRPFRLALGRASSLHPPAQRFDRRRGDNRLRCAADAHQHIHAGTGNCRLQCARHIAIGLQADPCANLPNAANEVGVARFIEHEHRQFFHRTVERRGNPPQVFGGRLGDVNGVSGSFIHHQLVHI